MILDKELEFSGAQAVTGTVVSTNVIDNGTTRPGLGAGDPMAVFISLGVVTLGNANVVVNIQSDDNVGFGSPTVVATLTILAAEVVAGRQFYIPLIPNYATERFTRISYVASTSNVIVNASLIPQDHQNRYIAFPAAVVIA